MRNIPSMEWDVEYTDEFATWWKTLAEYDVFVPIADRLYDEHLKEIMVELPKKEGHTQ